MQKYLIFGATGSVGSNLAKQLSHANKEIHLIGRNDVELDKLSSELGCDYTVLDILSDDINENLKNEFEDIDLAGIAYCIGSIDLKPLSKANKDDFINPIFETLDIIENQLEGFNIEVIIADDGSYYSQDIINNYSKKIDVINPVTGSTSKTGITLLIGYLFKT